MPSADPGLADVGTTIGRIAPLEVEHVENWNRLFEALTGRTSVDGLVICASGRPDTVGWQPERRDLAERVSAGASGNVGDAHPDIR